MGVPDHISSGRWSVLSRWSTVSDS